MSDFGFDDNQIVGEKLIKALDAKGRHYHTSEHISACLRHLESVRDQLVDYKTMALAFWFHDAIYNAFKSDNEKKSADWAKQFMKDNHASQDQIDCVEALIMATCHNAHILTGDAQILVDIDLSILGTSPDIYEVYEMNIRKEYRRVPSLIFKPKRRALLQSFLDRPRIYGSDIFHNRLENQARINLSKAVDDLK